MLKLILVLINSINQMLREINDLITLDNNLNLDKIEEYNYENISGHIFKRGIYKEIDDLQIELDENINYFSECMNEYNNVHIDFKGFFKLDYNDYMDIIYRLRKTDLIFLKEILKLKIN